MSKKSIIITIIASFCLLLYIGYTPDTDLSDLKKLYGNGSSKFLEIDGIRIHYRVEGNGPNLVLLHGTAASLHTWDGWVENLKDDFRIIRIDLPAYGLTGPHPASDYSMEEYTRVINDFLQTIEVDSFYLAGNSFGGNISWNFTLSYPEKVKKLILIDASGVPINGNSPMIIKLARNPVIAPLLRVFTPRFVIKNNIKQVYYDDDKITDQLIDRYYALARRPGNRNAFIERSKTDYDIDISELSRINCPTLVMWGQHDAWIPVADAAIFNKKITDSELIIFDNAGHVPMEEIPEESSSAAKEFLLKK